MKLVISRTIIIFAVTISMLSQMTVMVYAQTIPEDLKLPYAGGQSFVVAQGYHSLPTHIHKDDYAIDFTQNGCDAYAKDVIAAISGKAWVVQESGYNGGYGAQLLVLSGGTIVSRYAHLVAGSILVKTGDDIRQGMVIGKIGNTGLVMGAACAVHPGTHVHFAMDIKNPDGTFTAKNPEPISGYVNMVEGGWYLSDNTSGSPAQGNDSAAIVAKSLPETVSVPATAIINVSPKDASMDEGGVIALESNAPDGSSASVSVPAQSDGVQDGITLNDATSSSVFVDVTASAVTQQSVSSTGLSQGIVPGSPLIGGVSVSAPGRTGEDTNSGSSQVVVFSGVDVPSTSLQEVLGASTTSSIVVPIPSVVDGVTSLGVFDTSTLSVDLAWRLPQNATDSNVPVYAIFLLDPLSSSSLLIATTTAVTFSYAPVTADFGKSLLFGVQAIDSAGNKSDVATTTISLPDWVTTVQPIDDIDSRPSWYSDNWYDLGAGFSGTITSLSLEGYVNSDSYFSSKLALQEFSDSGYSLLDHEFPISDDAPFTQTDTKITIGHLKIPLHAEKYYRLTTLQAYQNRSVVLKGTGATGTAMWDNFVPGTGGVSYQYSFYPYLSAFIIPQVLPLAPPSFSGPLSVSFASTTSQINVAWPAAVDSDEPLAPLTYQVNISTSTSLSDADWRSVSSSLSAAVNVVFPNTYTIGVRALDDFGQSSQSVIATWSFPLGYAPVPGQFDHSALLSEGGGAQRVTFFATTTASAVDFWTAPIHAGYCCSQTQLSIYKEDLASLVELVQTGLQGIHGGEVPSGNPVFTFGPYDGPGESSYTFASPITFSPGSYWFVIATGPSGTTNPTAIYGSGGDSYDGGFWAASPGQDAFFRLQVASP